MLFLQRSCWLVGTLGMLMVLVPRSGTQQANSQTQRNPHSAGNNDRPDHQNTQAYEQGYYQGAKDQRDNLQPSTANWSNEAYTLAYQRGYRAGYCDNDKGKTGYYNAAYGNGPPVLRNGYYGYNAPNPYCESNGASAAFYRGNSKAPQNQVEYGGGG